jgi:hypothetical protein
MYQQVFTKIIMIPDFVRGHFVQWVLDPFFKGTTPYSFTLQVSQVLDFSEIAVEIPVGDSYFAVDNSNYKQSWSVNYYYRVKLETASGEIYYSNATVFGSTSTSRRKYAMASDIIRKEFLLCRFAGRQAWLLKRKTYGSVATQTVDPISGVPIADEREADYGVGVEGGYFSPIPCAFTVDRASADKQLDPSGLGVKETVDMVVRLPGYPLLEVRDVVSTNMDGYRYSVLSKDIVYFPGSDIPVSQKATLRLIPPTDTIYSLEVPIDANDF